MRGQLVEAVVSGSAAARREHGISAKCGADAGDETLRRAVVARAQVQAGTFCVAKRLLAIVTERCQGVVVLRVRLEQREDLPEALFECQCGFDEAPAFVLLRFVHGQLTVRRTVVAGKGPEEPVPWRWRLAPCAVDRPTGRRSLADRAGRGRSPRGPK